MKNARMLRRPNSDTPGSVQQTTWSHTYVSHEAHCNGDGVVEEGTDDERQCPTCGGSGFVPDDDDDREEVIHTTQPN
jgi:DnaJ-class molecular chaperone